MSAPGTIEGIILEASRATKLSIALLLSRSRVHAVCRPRQAIMVVLRERTTLSLSQIAKWLCIGDHTTIVHGIRKAKQVAAADPDFAALIDRLRAAEPIGAGSLAELAQETPEHVAQAVHISRKRKLRSRNEGASTKRAPVPVPKPIVRRLARVWVKSLPDKELIHLNESHDFLIDSEGRCQSEHDMRHNLTVGSMKLAAAINAARQVAV